VTRGIKLVDKTNVPVFHSSFYGPKYWLTWISLGFMGLIGRLPLSWARRLGEWLGSLFYYLAPARRRIASVNVALCFPELNAIEQKELVHRIMRSTGINFTETCVALWGPESALQGLHTFTGLEHLEAARKDGSGVLLLGAHFTTIDPCAHGLATKTKFDVVYRRDANELFAYKVLRVRESVAEKGIVRGDIRQLVRRLREGKVVWYAPDQDMGPKHSVFAPFFGVQAATITATSRIVRMGNAKVLPLSHHRDENGGYHLIIGAPLENFPSDDDVADATLINKTIETAVRPYPDQYLWVHRRFKTRPPGEPNPYK
jgi:KDO2-lipid IV(A) lauroyltransferase